MGDGRVNVQGGVNPDNPAQGVHQNYSGGGAHAVDGALVNGPIYNDGTYKYFGRALPGTALTAATWEVSRMRISDSYVQYADGDSNFDNTYDDLATVQAFTFV